MASKNESKFRISKNNAVILSISAVVITLALLFVFSKPGIVVNGGENMTLEVFEPYTDEGARASYFGINLNEKLSCDGSVDPDKVGTYTEKYYVRFLWKKTEVTKTVNVVDTSAPVLTLKGDPEIEVEDIDNFEDPGYTAEDNYDGDITDKVTVTLSDVMVGEDGENIVTATYTVSDSAGNTAKQHRFIRIADRTAPEVTLLGSSHITLKKGDKYEESGAEATDNIDGKVEVSSEGSVDTSTAGVYKITYMHMIKRETGARRFVRYASARRQPTAFPRRRIPRAKLRHRAGRIFILRSTTVRVRTLRRGFWIFSRKTM